MRLFVFLVLAIAPALFASGSGYYLETYYRDLVVGNLRFLEEGNFPDKPGSGYPWMTVEVDGKRAVLLCPEDGLGDALLVFSDGSIQKRKASLGAVTLSYYMTIKARNVTKWEKVNLGKGWEDLVIDRKGAKPAWIADYFLSAFFEATQKKFGEENSKKD